MTRRLAHVLVLAGSLGLCAVPARAESLQRIFEDANAAYIRGEPRQAVAGYERLLEAGVKDADVYFNLAVAHARLDQLGHAVLYFERALWLRPGDENAAQELAAARAILGKRRAEREGEASLQSRPPLLDAFLLPVSADAWATLLIAFNALFFAALLLRRRTRRDSARLGLAISLPILMVCIAVACMGLFARTEAFREGSAAIVLREQAPLLEGPDAKAETRGNAHQGQAARVLKREGAFARVQLEGGALGWMKTGDLGVIRTN